MTEHPPRATPRWRPLLFAALVVAIVVTQLSGLGSELTDPARVRDLLTGTGAWGPGLFVVVFALTHAVGFPSVVLVVVAAAVWPLWGAVPLSWAAGMLGTSAAYGFASWAGRDWALRRIPPRLRRLDGRTEDRGVAVLLGIRVLLLTPAPADWLFGISSMRYRTFAATTAVGLVPPVVVVSTATSGVVPLPTVVGTVTVVTVLLAGGAWLAARRPVVRRRLAGPGGERRPQPAAGRPQPTAGRPDAEVPRPHRPGHPPSR